MSERRTTLYERTESGGIQFKSRRRVGHVRVPNYVYDLWMPLLGVRTIGVYSVYCRLEREGTVKALSQGKLAAALRVSPNTLASINADLEECGFIEVRKPEGHERLMHWTTEITVLDPPQVVPPELIRKYSTITRKGETRQLEYEPLSTWLVDDDPTPQEDPAQESSPALPPSNASVTTQYRDALLPSNANVETLGVETLDVDSASRKNTDGDTSLSPPSDEPPLFPAEPLSPPSYLSKEERVARLRASRDARAAAAWAEGLPDPLWGEHSSVVERALKDPSIDAGGIRKLGRFLESELRMQVPWSSARLLKTWVAGLKDLHAVVGNDTDLVRDAHAHLKRERLPIANPHALVKMAQHFANERAAKREPGAVTLSEEQIRASLQNIITW